VSESSIENSGYGLFSLDYIPKNSVIGIYTGEHIPALQD
jgi:SET domain-containing protein